ncbi:hypothetical protein [Bacterioplanoides sp.]|uniref:hypothetical protein n=1 Tax=Bacterioplanoides sp. TaxID=2066072 RepID=UPI003B5B361B
MALTKVKGSVLPDVFPGVVWMFAGTESQIADGWQLCNGEGETSNGIAVPDLRDRMIICAGSDYEVGDTGGAKTATTDSKGSHSHDVTVDSGGSHSHSITVNSHTLTTSEMPSHSHTITGYCAWAYSDKVGQGNHEGNKTWTAYSNSAGSSGSHNHTASSNSTGSHTHSASSNSTGNHTHTVSTMNPYYALAFIIKL